jgi:hypothetical protein
MSFVNVFACLVHERRDCVADLVRNLRRLDPASPILLYNGGPDPHLVDRQSDPAFCDASVHIYPRPRRMVWGYLHDFAVDCLEHALQQIPFDTLTIVDSDQLAVRPGYADYIGRFLAERSDVGLFGTIASDEPMGLPTPAAMTAFREFELWRPFVRRFSRGAELFPQWTFWPGTVFTAPAARQLVGLFRGDDDFQRVLSRSGMWATEEVLFPSLTALLGFRVVCNPCCADFVKFRTAYSLEDAARALAAPGVYWMHPVPRLMDHPLRVFLRQRLGY